MAKGWVKEPRRHNLARMGIKTAVATPMKRVKVHDFEAKSGFESAWLRKFEKEYGSKISNVYDDNRGTILELENGEEYLVFNSYEDAEREAIRYVKDMLDEEPETFTPDWLNNFKYVTDTDKRIISGEEADNRVNDMSDEELIEDTSFQEEYESLDREETDLLLKKETTPSEDERISVIEKKKNEIITSARSEKESELYDETYDRLENDLDGWLDDMGYTNADLPSFVNIDTEKASEDAINIDGVAHFFATYDGNEKELDGKVLYRVN